MLSQLKKKHLIGFLFLFLFLLLFSNLGRLSGLHHLDHPVPFLVRFHSRGRNSQHPIRGQLGLHFVNVVPLGQDIPPDEVSRDEPVLVLLLFVLALHGDGIVGHLHGDFLRLELLHVQIGLEPVLVEADGGAGVPLGGLGTPRAEVSSRPAQILAKLPRDHRRQKVFGVQGQTEALVLDARWATVVEGIAPQPQRHLRSLFGYFLLLFNSLVLFELNDERAAAYLYVTRRKFQRRKRNGMEFARINAFSRC
jgi:hypothetical protein